METISRSLLTFLLNALWQVPVAWAIAALACRMMRNGPARHRHAIWVAALFAAVLLPAMSTRAPQTTGQQIAFPRSLATVPESAPVLARASSTQELPAAPNVSVSADWAMLLLSAYGLFVAVRATQFARALFRAWMIRRRASSGNLPGVLARCAAAFSTDGVTLLRSDEITGPVALHRSIVLPAAMFAESREDLLVTAVGHEMAHISRHDFLLKLLCELFYLPLSFHPAAILIRRGIENSREMACDELVTRHLLEPAVYARSMVTIAGAAMPALQPGFMLGVFDGDIFEERIRSLMERRGGDLRRSRLLLISGVAALAICAVVASSLALTAHAQGAAYGLMKQAEAAYNRGDYEQAIRQFDNAVRAEPSNTKARLLLANALLQQYVPGTGADRPYATRARQQYLAVLALDNKNHAALQGMMMLSANTKQFAEAHEWAAKAIEADATDKTAYYTAAFVDWAIAYPDYAAARQAAGMQPQDSGIIPDAALRQKVRTQQMARIEDGKRMLQTSLQLDPEYSDAMAYMNLLYRIEAGIANTPGEYSDLTAKADEWVGKALDSIRARAQRKTAAPGTAVLNIDGPVTGTWVAAPPPPPPPPPPTGQLPMVPPGRILVEGNVQQAKLVHQQAPIYPAQAQQAGVTGTVRLLVTIGKDGSVIDVKVTSGPPMLVAAAIEAVRHWTYQPTLLNGQPTEVLTPVSVAFGASRQ